MWKLFMWISLKAVSCFWGGLYCGPDRGVLERAEDVDSSRGSPAQACMAVGLWREGARRKEDNNIMSLKILVISHMYPNPANPMSGVLFTTR